MDAVKLQSFLDAVAPERNGEVLRVDPIPGGYSRETMLAQVRWADGTCEDFVLRGDPQIERSVFRSDRDREWILLNALVAIPGLRVPAPRWYDATGEHLGTKCIVSEAIAAKSMQAHLDAGANADDARRQFVDIIASVHTTNLGLVDDTVERPASWESYMDSMMSIYDEVISRQVDCDPVLRYARRKMRANRPPAVPLTLVHGDYQPGNFLLPTGELPVVIDWEFGHIGDPRTDLGYYTQIPMPPQMYLSDPEAFLAHYRALTGYTEAEVNPEIVEYFKFIGLANVLRQMVFAAEDVEDGEHRGILGPYMLIAIAHFHNLFLTVAESLPNVMEES